MAYANAHQLNGHEEHDMSRVAKLVERLRKSPTTADLFHMQSVRISEESHQKLIALSRVMGSTKSALAGELLEAAIDDAIGALPNEPADYARVNDYIHTGEEKKVGPREYVELVAEQEYAHILHREME